MRKIIYSTENRVSYFCSNDSPYIKPCIDGSMAGSQKCVAFCKFCGHPGFLTKGLRKRRDCIWKKCRYYVPKDELVIASPFIPMVELLYKKVS